MAKLPLKKKGDRYGQHDPNLVYLTEVRSFRGNNGETYIVYRYPRSKSKDFSYHTFVEVDDKAAFKLFCGVKTQGKKSGWQDVWPERKKKKPRKPKD